MRIFSWASRILLCLSLTACGTGWNLDELTSIATPCKQFEAELAKGYKDLAESEANKYDWNNSSYFARKGLIASSENYTVLPEEPQNWYISQEALPELKRARIKLMKMLTEKNKSKNPLLLARAQIMYDCWVEEQEKAWPLEHIKACRGEFFASIDNLKKH